ncbi:MAG: cytochrome P450, partial [Bdellovibrionales bacterium]|nr:cytochrome P450 [Bdellovibrionales bacterium]
MENLAQNNSNIENAIFRFFSPSLRTDKDPYLAYQEFRELGPIFRAPVPGDPWILSHYSSVYDALREKRLGHNSKATSSACPMHKIENDFAKMQEHWIFQQDPPEHTRIRAVLNKALSPKLIRTLEETVTKLAEELTDNCREKGEFDLISEIASPLPVKMIANLLGVSEADSKQFFEWTVAIARTLDPNFTDPSYVKAANDAAVGLTQYFKKHISSNRNIDSEYMLSSLIKAYENGDIKSEEEL